eukprot:376315-Prorocentrum_minimum.AAC.1
MSHELGDEAVSEVFEAINTPGKVRKTALNIHSMALNVHHVALNVHTVALSVHTVALYTPGKVRETARLQTRLKP